MTIADIDSHLIYRVITDDDTQRQVGWVQLNRPKAYNALCDDMMAELETLLVEWDNTSSIGAIVITGNEKAFAAGADIKELANRDAVAMEQDDPVYTWEAVARCKTPTIAAVRGLALGGGCELMMMCDMAIASDNAKFGQPEVSIGVMPGAGATQRLTRAIGRAKAMHLMLTGDTFTAQQAFDWGLLSQLQPDDDVWPTAETLALKIANQPAMAVKGIKQAIHHAAESTLSSGIAYERSQFHLTFASKDRTEGMTAFMEKRPPKFTHR
jgi:enoyl-CoA hydratase